MVTATATSNRKTASAKSRTSSSAKTSSKVEDAISLLTSDHDKVKKQFKQYDKLTDENEKQALAREICMELTVHTKLEEEIFYPAVRPEIKDDDLMNEAVVEHATAKDLIAQIESMAPSDPMYDAKVTVLGEYIDHHVKEEQDEMFPKVKKHAKKTNLDLAELGQRMKIRKQELMRSIVH
jgi:hemerythrin HHE cation binding domain-containing protein